MKILSIIVFLTISVFGIQIDTRLYEEGDTLAYYDQLSEKISNATAVDDEDVERLKSEKSLLEKLRMMVMKEPPMQAFNTELIGKEYIEAVDYINLFNIVADALEKKKKLEENQMFIQERLSYLKKRIEGIADPQHKSLLLYQLQFAYYKLKQQYEKISIENYQQFISEGEKVLSILISRINFDLDTYKITLAKDQQEIDRLSKKLVATNLAKERELLSQESISKKLADRLKVLELSHDKALTALADKRLLLGLSYYQKKDARSVLLQRKELRSTIKLLSVENTLYNAKLTVLENLTKSSDDSIDYKYLTVRENLLSFYENFYSYISTPFIVLDETPISFLSILRLLGILMLGFLIAKIYFKLFTKLHKRRKDMSTVSIKIIANIGATLIFFVTFVIAMSNIGLSITNLAVIAGALSIGVGFALRSLVSSIISGMVLLSENYIKLGDYIRIKDLTGKVMDIGFRATVIRTIDNIHILVPNSDLIDGQVINLTLEDRVRRIYIPFKVPYGADVKKIRSLILEAVMSSKIPLLRDVRMRKPAVWMSAVGESFIELELLVWIEGIRPSTKSNLLILIYDTLSAQGIAMPHPQLDLHIKDRRVLNALR
ncbi:mechanosensitive ion channel domain-containing protein [Sulfurovum sp.]|uniref:mechanosensitive ion channel family protein n=1 Tax=Sulfurovum sp. TaxID=1969726 RepID=UPI0028683639|nr:mechanosensitive ion channel domain-containing protein [Sulfurovum sp.]